MVSKALLCGLNAYPRSPLTGCVNDTAEMASTITMPAFGYRPEDVRPLIDGRATTQAILQGLEWLVEGARPGDRLLFHFSGHGVQVATSDRSEIDGLAEAICPIDFDWSPQRMITDKQLVKIFSRLPAGVSFNWVSDSCHSGDLTRNMPGPNDPDEIPRTIPLPFDIEWNLRAALSASYKKINRVGKIDRGIMNGMLDVGFISGCMSNQTSADTVINGRPCGALTHFLVKHLRANPTASLRTIVALVNADLRLHRYSQCPQVEGARADKPFLG